MMNANDINEFLKNHPFKEKEVLFVIEEQTLTSNVVDLEGEKITLKSLLKFEEEMNKNNLWGYDEHYSTGSPTSRSTKFKIVKMDDGIYHLKADIHILDKSSLEKLKNGEFKGFSLSFVAK